MVNLHISPKHIVYLKTNIRIKILARFWSYLSVTSSLGVIDLTFCPLSNVTAGRTLWNATLPRMFTPFFFLPQWKMFLFSPLFWVGFDNFLNIITLHCKSYQVICRSAQSCSLQNKTKSIKWIQVCFSVSLAHFAEKVQIAGLPEPFHFPTSLYSIITTMLITNIFKTIKLQKKKRRK